jgi:sugar lactone lactonase YvrE
MKKNIFFIFCLFLLIGKSYAQDDMPIGQWRSHLPFKSGIAVDIAGDIVYCATPTGLFSYNKQDKSVERYTKVNLLSDVNISTIRYSSQFKVLVIGYVNGNIDLLYEDEVFNLSDIKRKPLYGIKSINHITFIGNYAYLSCGFGIVVLDLPRKEIKDTYYLGSGGTNLFINDLASDGNHFFAATRNGIYSADCNSINLANFASWKKDTLLNIPNGNYTNLAIFNGIPIAALSIADFEKDTLYALIDSTWIIADTNLTSDIHSIRVSENQLIVTYNYAVVAYNDSLKEYTRVWTYAPGTPNPRCALTESGDVFWIADTSEGLVRYNNWNAERIYPNGPARSDVFNMAISGDDLYVAPGSVNSAWGNVYNNSGVYSFIGEQWFTLKDNNPAFDTLNDIICLAIDPSDKGHVYAGSFFNGLVEIKNGIVQNVYNETNSGLERPYSNYYWMGISGLAFDKDNNLWVVNVGCNKLLKMKKPDGTWYSFNMSPYVSQPRTYDVLIDGHNQKWVLLTNTPGILVFSENGTPENPGDDIKRVLTANVGNGNLPSNNVICLAEDLDGKIWFGTDHGVAVLHNPENISEGGNYDAQQIKIVQDGVTQLLLQFENVTSIAVDGANRKWFGTEKAGVFLMNEDCTEELLHFTEDNSPLLSNTITDIVINKGTGEVFFGTGNGIISYKGNATQGGETIEHGVYAYPNPVPSGYAGYVGIKGLMRNTTVKITDAAGNLVYETISKGGQAIWNAKNFDGKPVKSGVYFVLCSSEDGAEKVVTKIMVLN